MLSSVDRTITMLLLADQLPDEEAGKLVPEELMKSVFNVTQNEHKPNLNIRVPRLSVVMTQRYKINNVTTNKCTFCVLRFWLWKW